MFNYAGKTNHKKIYIHALRKYIHNKLKFNEKQTQTKVQKYIQCLYLKKKHTREKESSLNKK